MATSPRAPGVQLSVEEGYMYDALDEAERGRGRTRPNPIVGAVVVRAGKIIARGFHAKAGGPHAEVAALREAGARAKGADLYVNLEPCNHHGRTPPCTEALLAAGIKRVFVGSIDPNPKVRGEGVRRLRAAGVTVKTGVLGALCDAVNEQWFKFITAGTPWVLLKAAVTLDGQLATAAGDSRWVTGEASRRLVHRLRDELDGVVVGVGTALADDPRLTSRPGSFKQGEAASSAGRSAARDPVRIVVDTHARLPATSRMLRERSLAETVVAVGPKAKAARLRGLEQAGARLLRCQLGPGGRVALPDLLQQLGGLGLTSLLVEGGAALHGSFLEQKLWDELYLFLAPKVAGQGGHTWAGFAGVTAMAHARPLRFTSVALVEGEGQADVLIRARPQ
jgi:diaminohydroxyphosphoribosylaminopyrimidine deaminase/5-amino-6-(5-phosphoribosylamino)uracil reductase